VIINVLVIPAILVVSEMKHFTQFVYYHVLVQYIVYGHRFGGNNSLTDGICCALFEVMFPH